MSRRQASRRWLSVRHADIVSNETEVVPSDGTEVGLGPSLLSPAGLGLAPANPEAKHMQRYPEDMQGPAPIRLAVREVTRSLDATRFATQPCGYSQPRGYQRA